MKADYDPKEAVYRSLDAIEAAIKAMEAEPAMPVTRIQAYVDSMHLAAQVAQVHALNRIADALERHPE